MIFDHQDLTEEEREAFDVIKHKQLIESYLESANIPQHFKILSFVYHADEKNPHYHVIFSGLDKQTGAFGVNEFYIVMVEEEMKEGLDKIRNILSEPEIKQMALVMELSDDEKLQYLKLKQEYLEKKALEDSINKQGK